MGSKTTFSLSLCDRVLLPRLFSLVFSRLLSSPLVFSLVFLSSSCSFPSLSSASPSLPSIALVFKLRPRRLSLLASTLVFNSHFASFCVTCPPRGLALSLLLSLLSCSPFFLFFSKLVAAADALPENGARRPRKQDHGRPADDDQGQRHRRAGTGRTWTCLRLTLPAFAHDQPWTGCMPGRRLTPP